MKTIPFNEEQAKAGRPVCLDTDGRISVTVIHTHGSYSWCDCAEAQSIIHNAMLAHPADPALGHNPYALDEWTVETHRGGRLLVSSEIAERKNTPDIQAWCAMQGKWVGGASGSHHEHTYRTFEPPGYFLPKERLIWVDELPDEFLYKTDDVLVLAYSMIWDRDQIAKASESGDVWSRSLDGPWNLFTIKE